MQTVVKNIENTDHSFNNPISTLEKSALQNMTVQLIEMRYFCASAELPYLGHLIDMVTLEIENISE